MQTYVLDTSALITFRAGEAGAAVVEDLLKQGLKKRVHLFCSFVTLTEVFYIYWQRLGKNEAYKILLLLKSLPIEFVYAHENMVLVAGEIKANHSLSLADAYVAALAKEENAILVHKDPEYEPLIKIIKQQVLPYKG